MSVPHLDTRVIGNKPGLLFGPYAGWSPKFLKQGRVTDLPGSVKPNNILSMLGVGVSELGLVKYLSASLPRTKPVASGICVSSRPRRRPRTGNSSPRASASR